MPGALSDKYVGDAQAIGDLGARFRRSEAFRHVRFGSRPSIQQSLTSPYARVTGNHTTDIRLILYFPSQSRPKRRRFQP